MSWLVMSVVPMTTWAQQRPSEQNVPHEQNVSGRLSFADAGANCGRIMVELEVIEMQPVESVYLDANCGFKFTHISKGSYFIHVDIDGYDEVRQRVDVSDVFADTPNLITMLPAPGRGRGVMSRGGKPVIDVSEILDQYPKKAVDLYNKARESRDKGKNGQAIDQLQQATKIAPTFYQAHNTLGLAYKDAGRLEDAEQEFIIAHQINRYSAEPLVNLSGLYLDKNEPERAVEVSEEAVEANSRSVPALFNLGLALYRVSRLDKAETTFKKCLELAPKMFQVHLALANVYLKLRRFDSLLDQLNTYLQENPTGPDREQVERLRNQVIKAKGGDGQ
jgi:thioredoxin-like negative regulator of GroEL